MYVYLPDVCLVRKYHVKKKYSVYFKTWPTSIVSRKPAPLFLAMLHSMVTSDLLNYFHIAFSIEAGIETGIETGIECHISQGQLQKWTEHSYWLKSIN